MHSPGVCDYLVLVLPPCHIFRHQVSSTLSPALNIDWLFLFRLLWRTIICCSPAFRLQVFRIRINRLPFHPFFSKSDLSLWAQVPPDKSQEGSDRGLHPVPSAWRLLRPLPAGEEPEPVLLCRVCHPAQRPWGEGRSERRRRWRRHNNRHVHQKWRCQFCWDFEGECNITFYTRFEKFYSV